MSCSLNMPNLTIFTKLIFKKCEHINFSPIGLHLRSVRVFIEQIFKKCEHIEFRPTGDHLGPVRIFTELIFKKVWTYRIQPHWGSSALCAGDSFNIEIGKDDVSSSKHARKCAQTEVRHDGQKSDAPTISQLWQPYNPRLSHRVRGHSRTRGGRIAPKISHIWPQHESDWHIMEHI